MFVLFYNVYDSGIFEHYYVFVVLTFFSEENIETLSLLGWFPSRVNGSMVDHNGAGCRSVFFFSMLFDRGCVVDDRSVRYARLAVRRGWLLSSTL